MSSLAGALASPDVPYKQDVDMHSASFDDAPPDTSDHLKEEEMGDLFGEDSNVDFVHHGRLVSRRSKVLALASLARPYLNQIVTTIWPQGHRAPPNQETLPPSLHLLQMTVSLHRTGNEERP